MYIDILCAFIKRRYSLFANDKFLKKIFLFNRCFLKDDILFHCFAGFFCVNVCKAIHVTKTI